MPDINSAYSNITIEERFDIFQKLYSISMLHTVIWREARGEDRECQIAVGCSIRNRVNNPKWWGRNYIEVISKRWQYSAMSAPGDPNLIKYPTLDALSFKIYQIAWNIVQNRIQSNVPGADSYYDISIPAPNWADENKFVKQVGRIRFYNLDKDIEVELLPEYLVNIN